ncbi:hypothetical protein GQ53DRAFT_745917 [Thozetella sp. PMI_491]|nr:hypothetical protein GQ53DRAFT_745917 [Thozetella sp. PMI_491]
MEQTAPFPFLNLPPEIRNSIYQIYIEKEQQKVWSYRGSEDGSFCCVGQARKTFLEQPFHQPMPALALACRQVHYEIRPFASNDTVICNMMTRWGKSAEIGFQLYGKLRLERLRRLVLVNALYCQPHEICGGFLQFELWYPFIEELLQRSTALEELVIDWNSRQLGRQTREQIWKTIRDIADGDASLSKSRLEIEAEMGMKLLELLGRLKGLRTVVLCGPYPPDWPDALRNMTSANLKVR